MGTDRPSFRRTERAAPPRQRVALMGLLLLLCAGLLMGRSWLQSRVEADRFVVVEVAGDVPSPGFHPVAVPATVAAALVAAGVQSTDNAPLSPGARVTVDAGRVLVGEMDQRLVFGLPILLNTASRAALMTVPGIGPARAEAILSERVENGPFASVEDLDRVPGIGPGTVARIRPFLAVD